MITHRSAPSHCSLSVFRRRLASLSLPLACTLCSEMHDPQRTHVRFFRARLFLSRGHMSLFPISFSLSSSFLSSRLSLLIAPRHLSPLAALAHLCFICNAVCQCLQFTCLGKWSKSGTAVFVNEWHMFYKSCTVFN